MKMKLQFKAVFLCLLLSAPLLSAREQTDGTGDKIIITGERPEAEKGAGQKTVIEKEEWERKGARTVAEAVRLSPGVTVSQSGTTLDNSTVSIRGSGGEQVLVMINGIPLNNGKGDPVNLNTLSLNNVKKIEVIRGGNSAVYGEGAFGGVINLIVEDEAAVYTEGNIYLSIGSFQTSSAGGSLKAPLNDSGTLTAEVSGEYRRTAGGFNYDSGVGKESRVNSDGWADNIRTGLDWNVNGLDHNLFSLNFNWYQGQRGIPGLMEFTTPEANLEESRLGLSARYRFTGYAGQTLDAEYSFLNQSSLFENSPSSLKDQNVSRSHRGRIDLSLPFGTESRGVTPLMGGVFSFDTLSSTNLQSRSGTTLPGNADQADVSFYSRVEIVREKYSLTPALRWDYNQTHYVGWESRSDSKPSWSLTTSYRLSDILTLKANLGTAYHSPGFDDLFWSGGSFAEGNPDLLPEESFNWDGGLYFKPVKGLDISTVYFQSTTDHLIQWLPTAGGTWRPSNLGQSHSQGLENTLSWLLPLKEKELLFLEMTGSYTWMKMVEKTSASINLGNQLPYRPVHTGAGSLSLMWNQHSLTVSSRYMGQRFTNMANTKDLDPVITFDAVLKLVLKSGFYTSFSVLNIGGTRYIDKLGYPIPGREWSLTGGYRF